jgi:murein DD-endopeptidase MepM/ murein hydrolase activator NlpD
MILRSWPRSLFSMILLALLAACAQGANPDPKDTPGEDLASAASTPTISADLPIEAEEDLSAVLGERATAFLPDPSGEAPLRFTLPTPGQAPISLWRPPLYDTPWALGPNDHFYFSRPIAADVVNWPVADYRYGGIFFSSEIVHTGIDIPAKLHTPVQAAGSGKVVWAGYGLYYGQNDPNDPYGLAVTIRHDFGFNGQYIYTVYAHMDRIDVVTGEQVETGQPVGIIGTTGLTTGPHLHFEVRMERNSYFTTYNPELWLAPPQGWGVLVGRVLNTNNSLLGRQDVVVRSFTSPRRWVVRSYGNQAVNSDPYFKENLVLNDLPAGDYEIAIDYLDRTHKQRITISPGAVTYFTFLGDRGFNLSLPVDPGIKKVVDEMIPPP